MPKNHERQTLAFKNANKAWVVKELDKLLEEWRSWQIDVEQIQDHPYNRNTESEVFKDGTQNMKRHRILQEKTLVFLDNYLDGHGFIRGRDGTKIDRSDLRLKIRVQHRIDDLDELRACIDYARVPDSYWKAKGKELADKIINVGPEKAAEVAAKYLKGDFI